MPERRPDPVRHFVKPAFFVLCLLPLAVLVFDFLGDRLSANPIADVTHETGDWTLRFLLLTLCVTPVQRLTGLAVVAQFRRVLGLFAFFYGVLHFSTYLVLDKFFAWDEIIPDLLRRRFIIVGSASLLLMIPLAATSFAAAQRWLGGRRWKALHRLAYVVPVGGVIHYLWLVKADIQRPIAYGVAVGLLLLVRLVWWGRRRARPRPTANTA